MVCKNENLMLAAFQVMTSSFKYFNNGLKLAIVSFVFSFYKNHFLKKKATKFPLPKLVLIIISSGLVLEAYWLSISPIA